MRQEYKRSWSLTWEKAASEFEVGPISTVLRLLRLKVNQTSKEVGIFPLLGRLAFLSLPAGGAEIARKGELCEVT